MRYDGTDNLIDPSTGWRAGLTVTPWFSAGTVTAGGFTSAVADLSAYQTLAGGRAVLAERLGIGSVVGASLGGVPHDKRLYAGGGGSVRGYGFQKVGPIDDAGKPTGGRSRLELGLEVRVKVTETIGVVPFVDAGAVYDRAFPDGSEPLRVGTGIGLRYQTGFGPLRADFAVPLSKVRNDRGWQVYLSFGQAF